MKLHLEIGNEPYWIDTSQAIDLSMAIKTNGQPQASAWYRDKPKRQAVTLEDWTGSVAEGAAVNFNDLMFNPHAHGTHTECLGHITEAFHSVEGVLKESFFITDVISVTPTKVGNDLVLTAQDILSVISEEAPQAVVIRTLPNSTKKQTTKYDHTHWPFLEPKAAKALAEMGVMHLLIDLPSVDPEQDQGALLAHRAFWQMPDTPRYGATITEFIYVPDAVIDGRYLLELQTAAIENDATLSRPLLYVLQHKNQ